MRKTGLGGYVHAFCVDYDIFHTNHVVSMKNDYDIFHTNHKYLMNIT